MRSIDDYQIDPEPPDENDPEFRHEVFQILREQGCTPGDLLDPADASAYARWLEEQQATPPPEMCPDDQLDE